MNVNDCGLQFAEMRDIDAERVALRASFAHGVGIVAVRAETLARKTLVANRVVP